VKKLTKYDASLGLIAVTCAVFSIWLVFSINNTLTDARAQMKAMPRSFLIDIINSQNRASIFQENMHQYFVSGAPHDLRRARDNLVRLTGRPGLLLSTLAQLHLPQEKVTAFTDELEYLKENLRVFGTVLDSSVPIILQNSEKITELLISIEDSMAFLYTEGNGLLNQQAKNQISVLGATSTTLSSLVLIVLLMFVGLTLTLRKVYLQKSMLQKFATEDALTLLRNRRSYDDIIKSEFARVKRTGGQLTLLLLDLDHFKQFNDTYGHSRGDEALARVASVLRATMKRQDDWAFRLGGEEFACVLSTDTRSAANDIAEIVRSEIYNLRIAHSASGTADVLTVSIGLAHLPDPSINTENSLYVAADKALYEAKRTGRNRICTAPTSPSRVHAVSGVAH